jgi:epoxide hydrolase 4
VDSLTSVYLPTNGIRLHCMTAGPQHGKPVILLHGFPEFWYSWRKQIQPLAEAGYRVLAPDQRGYNLSDKPDGIGNYQLDILVEDIVGLIDQFGDQKVNVVGHDWGAVVAWTLAIQYPEKLDRLVIINVPHPGIQKKTIKVVPRQLLSSWYIGFFQIPFLPEFLLRARNWAGTVRALLGSSRPGTFRLTDLEKYRIAWNQENAITNMLNWYRALLRMPPAGLSGVRVEVPVRMLWGVHDVALRRELAALSIDLCDDGQLTYFENATHWVHHEEPEEVNRIIIEFLNASSEKSDRQDEATLTAASRQNRYPPQEP